MKQICILFFLLVACTVKYNGQKDDFYKYYQRYKNQNQAIWYYNELNPKVQFEIFKQGEINDLKECNYSNEVSIPPICSRFNRGYYRFRLTKYKKELYGSHFLIENIQPKYFNTPENEFDVKYIYFILIDDQRAIYYSPYNKFIGSQNKFLKLDPNSEIELLESNKCYSKSKKCIKGYYFFKSPNKIETTYPFDSSYYSMYKILIKPISNPINVDFIGEYLENKFVGLKFTSQLYEIPKVINAKLYKNNLLRLKNVIIFNNELFGQVKNIPLESTFFNGYKIDFEFIPSPIILNYKNNKIKDIIISKDSKNQRHYTIIYANCINSSNFNQKQYENYIGF